MNTEQCNLLQTRILWLLRGFQECFPQNLLKTDLAGRLGRPLYGSLGLKRLTPEQQRFFREKGFPPLDCRYTGLEAERPQFQAVRGRRYGGIV